jgi:hypothetical protein
MRTYIKAIAEYSKGLAVACLLAYVGVTVLTAQSVQDIAPSQKLNWKQSASTLAEANSYRYTYFLDGSTTGTVFVSGCTGTTSPFNCTSAIPANVMANTSSGTHTVTITASVVLADGTALDSGKSVVCSFRFATAPATPTNLLFV